MFLAFDLLYDPFRVSWYDNGAFRKARLDAKIIIKNDTHGFFGKKGDMEMKEPNKTMLILFDVYGFLLCQT